MWELIGAVGLIITIVLGIVYFAVKITEAVRLEIKKDMEKCKQEHFSKIETDVHNSIGDLIEEPILENENEIKNVKIDMDKLSEKVNEVSNDIKKVNQTQAQIQTTLSNQAIMLEQQGKTIDEIKQILYANFKIKS